MKRITIEIGPQMEELLLQFLHTDTMDTNRPIVIVYDKKNVCTKCDPACDGKECSEHDEIAFFFSLEEARKYKVYQRHNLRDPYIFAHSPGYSNNGDWIPFYDLLQSIAEKVERGDSVVPQETEEKQSRGNISL